ncbi:MAG: MFS transporter [Spirochaetales bacterium]|nr:MFS transporter [Spirochaetales bacterium]
MQPAFDFKKNRFLLLQIVLLDLIGFSLIFPITPHLLEYYLAGAGGHSIDSWVSPVSGALASLWPSARPDELIILYGGVLGSIYAFLQFLCSPLWGQLSDSLGRRPVLILTSLGLALSYFFWLFSTSFTAFILSRIFGGIMAGNLSVASAAIADMSSRENRSAHMGLLGATFGLGFIIGPLVGGLAAQVDMREWLDFPYLHPFSFCALVSLILSALSAVRNYTSLKETLPAGGSGEVRGFFAQARQVRGGVHRIVLLNFIYLFIFAGYEFTVTFFYKLDFHLSPLQIGFIFLYIGLLIAVGQGGLVRILSRRYTERWLCLVGIALVPLPLFLFSLSAPSVLFSLLLLAPITLGTALFQPSITALASLVAQENQQGLVMGYVRSSGSLARAVGPILGSILYWAYGIVVTYSVLAIFMCLAFFLTLTLKEARTIEKDRTV